MLLDDLFIIILSKLYLSRKCKTKAALCIYTAMDDNVLGGPQLLRKGRQYKCDIETATSALARVTLKIKLNCKTPCLSRTK